jgi:hypothetical protein
MYLKFETKFGKIKYIGFAGEASGVNHPRPVAMDQLRCFIIRHLVWWV